MHSLAIAALAASTALAAPGAIASCGDLQPANPSCTRARIGGQIQCLAVGTRCRPRYERIYNSYGFTCKRSRDGRFRLRERIFIGPPVP